jgi:O-antigen/teichoic acid export membrane protein
MIANFAGQGWIALMSFAFVPLYLKFVGAEGYGLIGFFVVLSSSLAILDAGLGAAAIREIACFPDAEATEKERIISLISTIEKLLLGGAVLIGMLVVALAPLIAKYWLNIEADREASFISALRFMGVAVAIQFPVGFYSGCLIGLQKQISLNLITSLTATFRSVGAALVLWLYAPTVEAFFAWQCITTVLTALWLRFSLVSGLPAWSAFHSFDFTKVINIKKFALSVAGINVLAFLLTQIDKIILSKILPIREFGFYMLAWTLGTVALRLVGPIFNAYYPKLTQLFNVGDSEEFARVYLRASGIVAAAVVPLTVCFVFYSEFILATWTGNPEIAKSIYLALAFIAVGTMLNAFMHMPYAAQLASGFTKLSFWQNVCALFFVVPATYVFAMRFGVAGAALPWLLLNTAYLFICAPIMFRVMLREQLISWYGRAVFVPVAIALVCAISVKFLSGFFHATYPTLFIGVCVCFVVSSVMCLAFFTRCKARESLL